MSSGREQKIRNTHSNTTIFSSFAETRSGMQALLDVIRQKNIRRVILSEDSVLTLGAAEALASFLMTDQIIQTLDLGDTVSSREGTAVYRAITQGLSSNNSIVRLDLSESLLPDAEHVGFLNEALKVNRTLQALVLNNNTVARYIIGPWLTELRMSSCKMNAIDVGWLIILNPNLLILDISDNPLVQKEQPRGLRSLAIAIRHTSQLRRINLSSCFLEHAPSGDQSVFFTALLTHLSISSIDLSHNLLAPPMIRLAGNRIRQSSNRIVLDLDGSMDLSDLSGQKEMMGALVWLASAPVSALGLAGINLNGAPSLGQLWHALSHNAALTRVDLRWNGLSGAAAKELVEKIEYKNDSDLQVLDLRENNLRCSGTLDILRILKKNRQECPLARLGLDRQTKCTKEQKSLFDGLDIARSLRHIELMHEGVVSGLDPPINAWQSLFDTPCFPGHRLFPHIGLTRRSLKAWQGVSVLVAFYRAVISHPFRTSILSLIPMITELLEEGGLIRMNDMKPVAPGYNVS